MRSDVSTDLSSALLNFLLPGLGYLRKKLYAHAAFAFLSVFLLFLLGLALGGRFFSLFDRGEGMLALIFGLCDLGVGATYLLCVSLGLGTADKSFLATSEYGNVFLMTAGLINYLQVLDVYDFEARGHE